MSIYQSRNKHDSLTNEHLVKVLPLYEYKNSETYRSLEEELLFDFINKFPNECIVFLSEGDWIDINEPDEVFEGLNYSLENELSFGSNMNDISFHYNYLFDFSQIEDDIFNISEIVDKYTSIEIIADQTINLPYFKENIININCKHSEAFSGFNDYALAA